MPFPERDYCNRLYLGAICAAPAVILAHHGLVKGRRVTCYPSQTFKDLIGDVIDDDDIPVVCDDNLVTSKYVTLHFSQVSISHDLFAFCRDARNSVAHKVLFFPLCP